MVHRSSVKFVKEILSTRSKSIKLEELKITASTNSIPGLIPVLNLSHSILPDKKIINLITSQKQILSCYDKD